MMVGELTSIARARYVQLCGAAVPLAAALWLCACSGGDNSPAPSAVVKPQATTAPAPKKGPTAEQLTAGMVEAVAQGKSQAPVNLKFELAGRPKVGQPLEINLALIPQIEAGPVSVQVTAADGFDLGQSSAPFEIPAVDPGEVYRHTLRVTPSTDGVLFVAVTVSMKHEEVADSRGFSIPVITDR